MGVRLNQLKGPKFLLASIDKSSFRQVRNKNTTSLELHNKGLSDGSSKF